MAKAKKISKNKQMLESQVQLDLIQQYFETYNLMNHYQNWLKAKLEQKHNIPNGLDMKIFFNPITKIFRKIWQRIRR